MDLHVFLYGEDKVAVYGLLIHFFAFYRITDKYSGYASRWVVKDVTERELENIKPVLEILSLDFVSTV